MASKTPSHMKAWQYRATSGGFDKHLKLDTIEVPKPKANQHLVRVHAVSLNPVDYKIAENPLIGSFAAPKPATPGIDVAGEIVTPAKGSTLTPGTLIVGFSGGPLPAGKACAEYTVMAKEQSIAVPAGVSATDAATLPVAAITAYQSIAPYVKAGDHVFWYGGSSGVGTFAIQIAKVLGCHITVTCSSRNIELCKGLGADEVIDYTAGDVVAALAKLPYKIDHVVDGIGVNHALYWRADQYTRPGALFVSIAFSPSVSGFGFMFGAALLPSFLGGGKRKFKTLMAVLKEEDLQQVATWLAEKKIKAEIDSRYSMDEVPEAYRKLKTSRARGKVVVEFA